MPESPSSPGRAPSSEYGALLAEIGACPYCRRPLEGRPNRCPHCGKLLGDAAHDLKRVAADERLRERRRKNAADVLFLVGLLAGGPLLAMGGRARLGLFVLLGGGLASALYRWTRSSLGGSLLIGSLAAAIVAVAVTGSPGAAGPDDGHVGEAARAAYATALARAVEGEGGLVEARGPGQITAWFELPTAAETSCGDYPDDAVRRHLAELGFVRVVVVTRTEAAGICSFKP